MSSNRIVRDTIVVAVFVLTSQPFVVAGTIYVDVGASTGANDGASWPNAYLELQSALSAAVSGDEIWVAQGVYFPDYNPMNGTHTGARTATFKLASGVTLYGGFPLAGGDGTFAARSVKQYSSILSGDIGLSGDPSDNAYHIVTGGATNATAILDGFTVSDGNANGTGANVQGGGLANRGGSPTIRNCIFTRNMAQTDGGAISNFGSPLIVNCLFHNNTAQARGGGIFNDGGSQTILNCTFSNNSAGTTGGGLHNLSSSSSITNCVVWGNTGGAIGGNPVVTYCDVEGGYAGVGNLDLDPLFVNSSSDDYRLGSSSPAIDAGDNTAPGLRSIDLDGGPRVQNGVVDMGAYEFTSVDCGVCTIDLDGNGTIDQGDINMLTGCFGGCYAPGDPCAVANVDGDVGGCVGTGDYAALAGCMNKSCGQCTNCAGP